MRGNAWQITAIISIILVVILIVPLVIMGRNFKNRADETQQAKDALQKANADVSRLEEEAKTLKKLIGNADAAALDDLTKQYDEVMERMRPGEDGTTRSYYDTLTVLLGDLDKEREEHQKTKNEKEQTDSDLKNERAVYEAAAAAQNKKIQALEGTLAKTEKSFADSRNKEKLKYSAAVADQKENLAEAEGAKEKAEELNSALKASNDKFQETNIELASQLEDVKYPNLEYPAGKIVSVDQHSGLAVVNLGSADGLTIRTMFSVYHSSITGLSFRTAAIGKEAVYCDVCKREISNNVSKASVEVMRLLGAHRAEVRILDDVLTDPIMVGDVVYSPIWKPGHKQRFALAAGMNLPGTTTGVDGVRQLIELNGGEVECWIDEKVENKEDCLCSADGKGGGITPLTTYIVINEESFGDLDPAIGKAQDRLLKEATDRAVKKISLTDLLMRMGWKNVTPVYTFGSKTMTNEMRVVPLPHGMLDGSMGRVSGKFAPDNLDARVSAKESNPVLDSEGRVSSIFSAKPPATPASSGRTSDLFRPRKPATGQE